jgi:hypothetical protein
MNTPKILVVTMAAVAGSLIATTPVRAYSNPAGVSKTTTTTTSSLSLAGFYLSGKYGRSQSTDIYYVPLTFRTYTGRFGFSVSLPYLRKTGPANVIPNIGSVGTGSTVRTTHSGMGDVQLGASYRVWNDAASGLALTLGAKVKLGTASYSQGLGTGKNDYALQAGLSRSSGPWYLAIIGGYRKQGSPAGLKLKNVGYGEADVIYRLDEGNNIGLSTFYTQASLASSTDRLMSVLYYGYNITHAWAGTFYLMKGFTRIAPDTGAGVSLRYSF